MALCDVQLTSDAAVTALTETSVMHGLSLGPDDKDNIQYYANLFAELPLCTWGLGIGSENGSSIEAHITHRCPGTLGSIIYNYLCSEVSIALGTEVLQAKHSTDEKEALEVGSKLIANIAVLTMLGDCADIGEGDEELFERFSPSGRSERDLGVRVSVVDAENTGCTAKTESKICIFINEYFQPGCHQPHPVL
ncbi:hypothetical protein TWF788_008224 [Orbilia oligospora]|uniref:Uncharacterized protein n=1 Tax=Orbilia oligospora TaxID=2813651 RepID=A0A7C8U674_ORBOL|nr:hypothetical protein TWF788_008224 [Orbilia oligospora]